MAFVALVATAFVVGEICDNVPAQYRRNNQTCEIQSDCLNSNVSGRVFQPWWYGDFLNMNAGLTCYKGWCARRRAHGEMCDENANCKSGICATKEGAEYKVCYDIGSLKLGQACPIEFADIAAHNEGHHICSGNAYCAPVDFDRTAQDSPTVCRHWAGKGEECHVVWTAGANSVPVRHTCDPELSELYCQPTNETWAPVGAPSLIKQRLNIGHCAKVPVNEASETCATIRGTAQRPFCEFDEFCSFNTTDPVCKGLAHEDDLCSTDEDCSAGKACNSLEPGGPRCRKTYDYTDSYTGRFDRTIFCDIGYVLDIPTRMCVKDTYDNDCLTDADCNPPAHAHDTLINHFFEEPQKSKGHMFCNKKPGTLAHNKCRDLFAPRDGCKDEAVDMLQFTAQTLKEGRLIQTVSCFSSGCFSVRSIYKKFRWYGENLMCCSYREESDNVCLKHSEAVWSVSRNAWLAMDADGQHGAVCIETGMSTVSIAVLAVIFGVLFMVVLFVLVKEFTYVPPVDEPSEEAEKSAATAPNTGEEEENKAVEGSPNEPKP